MERLKLATVWLGGCSGCHMSLLDLDEWLLELATVADLVYSPISDVKIFPSDVDLALVEGAVANDEHLELAHTIRRQTKTVVALGDCAVTGNVTALRNPLGSVRDVLQEVYINHGSPRAVVPDTSGIVPVLLDRVLPLHAVVPVDIFLPGCPPSAARIKGLIETLLAGKVPTEPVRFG
ncbi:oxidoreductase [Candidatus Viridilinea mediisalina]|uniref:Oxidoreductase n=1 Tax=Candidatus Viridilinea mediisalina TaxID=2024553 RepID=A0A2A6RDZ7_9CHLR|nr:oxidoreductase [Candidatus Viridilinea mediisalina]PDW01136.1 oxidoreductase [Candidatus Viridilinea mediisalina]